MKKAIIARRKPRRAFTLIELVVVLAIIGVLLMVVVPRVGVIYDRQLVEQQARVLEQELLWLRSEARSSGEKATFKRENSSSYTLSAAGKTERRELVSERVTLSASALGGQIIFEPRGTAFDKCTLTLRCGTQTRTVVVSNLGHIRVGVTG